MQSCIAALRVSASRIRFTLYDAHAAERVRYRGLIAEIGSSTRLEVWDGDGRPVAALAWRAETFDHRAASREVLRTAADLIQDAPVVAIGHRVRQGGFPGPVCVTPKVLADLVAAAGTPPPDLAAIEAIAEAAPHIPQVACFDPGPFGRTDDAAIARQTRAVLGLDMA